MSNYLATGSLFSGIGGLAKGLQDRLVKGQAGRHPLRPFPCQPAPQALAEAVARTVIA